MDDATFARRVGIAVLVVAVAGLFATILVVAPQVPLLALGALLGAIALDGLADPLRRALGLGRRLSIVFVVVLVVAVSAASTWIAGAQLAQQVSELTQSVPASLEELRRRVPPGPWDPWLESPAAEEAGRRGLLGALGRLRGLLSTAAGLATGVLALLAMTLYLALEPGLYARGVLHLVPPPQRRRAAQILVAVVRALRWWLVGRVAAMTAVGILTWIGLLVIGSPLALVLGFLAGILTFVPFLGPIAAAIPALIVAIGGGVSQVLAVAALYLGVQLVENDLLTPWIQSRTVSLPPVVLIAGQIGLGLLFGLLGVLLATPIIVASMVVLQAAYVQDVLGDPVALLGEDDEAHDAPPAKRQGDGAA